MKVANTQLTSPIPFPTEIWQIIFEYALTFCTARSSIPRIKAFLVELTGEDWVKILSNRHRSELIFERLSTQQVEQASDLFDYVLPKMIQEDEKTIKVFFNKVYEGVDIPDKKKRLKDYVETTRLKLEKKEVVDTTQGSETVNPSCRMLYINMLSLLSNRSIENYLSSYEPCSKNKLFYLTLYIAPISKLVGYEEQVRQYRDSFFQEIKTNIMRRIKEDSTDSSSCDDGLEQHLIIDTYFQP